jgi:FF domain
LIKEEKEKSVANFIQLLRDKLRPRFGITLTENTQWKEVKAILKDEPRYLGLKSSSLKEKLFNEFILNEVLVTPGQKRARLLQ